MEGVSSISSRTAQTKLAKRPSMQLHMCNATQDFDRHIHQLYSCAAQHSCDLDMQLAKVLHDMLRCVSTQLFQKWVSKGMPTDWLRKPASLPVPACSASASSCPSLSSSLSFSLYTACCALNTVDIALQCTDTKCMHLAQRGQEWAMHTAVVLV